MKRAALGALVILAVLAISADKQSGPKQPVAFSHKVMANYNRIDCYFCHPYASVSVNAGMPSVDKCLVCHDNIPFGSSEITKLKGYKRQNEPIPWVRVTKLPDYVRFNHECHIAGGHPCEECHGDLKSMDSAVPVHDFKMGFCTNCHRRNNVTTDCYICHY
ncbi:MAG TPA: cytochrome c3 family protein [Armatimonadota bacterium]|nr:cytochrome c3 family protein [Armatimonadota bacterium]